MNVLFLINFAGKAGTEKYVENLIRLGSGKIRPFFVYHIAGELSEKLEAAGLPCKQIKMGWASLLTAAKELAAFCREHQIDVIHAQYPRENIAALLSKRYYNKPRVVLTNHLTLRLTGPKGLIWRRLNRHFSPKNHRIIAVCNEGRDIMLDNGVLPQRIQVIFNGIEPAGTPEKSTKIREELGLSQDCFVMTILARFAPEKGLGFLVDSLARLNQQTDRPFCCLICGDGELFPEISEKISALGLSESIRLLGFRKDVPDILLGSDLYLCSSSHNEAMSFAILEGMNAGLPLVVTDVGGNRDLAENRLQCGFVVDYGDVPAFAERMQRLMDDPALHAQFSAAAVEKIAAYFDLNKLADEVFAAYH